MGERRGRGEGSVEQLPSGKFRAILSAGRTASGKRRRMTYTASTKQAALRWLRSRQAEAARGELADDGRMTLGDWLQRWLETKKTEVEPKSWQAHDAPARRYLIPRIGQVRLGRLKWQDVESLYTELAKEGVTADQRNRVAVTLRAALAEACRRGLILGNPAKMVKRPKVDRREIHPLNQHQAFAFLVAAARHRLAALYDVLLDTGVRPGEALALHWTDLLRDSGKIHVHRSLEQIGSKFRVKATKTKRGVRYLRLSPRALQSILRHRDRMRAEGRDTVEGPIFVSRTGRFVHQETVKRAFKTILRRAGIPDRRLYDLRHTAATLWLAHGVDIKTVSLRLGHERIETTLSHYVHLLPSMEEKAISVATELFGKAPVR